MLFAILYGHCPTLLLPVLEVVGKGVPSSPRRKEEKINFLHLVNLSIIKFEELENFYPSQRKTVVAVFGVLLY